MYKIKGFDQREYGPVSEQELRQWITQSRANAQTMAQKEGSANWQPLSAFSEFAALLAPGAGTPATTPPVIKPNAEALAAEIIARGYQVDIGSCISRGWDLVKTNFGLTVGTTLLVLVIPQLVPYAVPVVGHIAVIVLDGVLKGGIYLFYLKLIRGERTGVADGFSGFTIAFVQLLLAGIVSSLLILVGLCLCVVPGVYLAVSWIFAFPLVIDKKLDFWEAMEVSRKVVGKQWWQMFGLAIVAGLVAVAGVLACGIGIFVTIPIMLAAITYAYEDIFGAGAAKAA